MKLAAFCICAVLCAPAQASFMTGEQLRAGLSLTNYGGTNWAEGYVSGIADDGEFEGHFCVPESATSSQAGAVVLKYLNAHPENWQAPASLLVGLAFIEAWPCYKGQASPVH
jgi:hypothetical protein